LLEAIAATPERVLCGAPVSGLGTSAHTQLPELLIPCLAAPAVALNGAPCSTRKGDADPSVNCATRPVTANAPAQPANRKSCEQRPPTGIQPRDMTNLRALGCRIRRSDPPTTGRLMSVRGIFSHPQQFEENARARSPSRTKVHRAERGVPLPSTNRQAAHRPFFTVRRTPLEDITIASLSSGIRHPSAGH
jgi:hypothetical protein